MFTHYGCSNVLGDSGCKPAESEITLEYLTVNMSFVVLRIFGNSILRQLADNVGQLQPTGQRSSIHPSSIIHPSYHQ